jgi:prevent-host-death family protein
MTCWKQPNDYDDHNDHLRQRVGRSSRTWAVAKAKAQLSSVIDRALSEGPQTITRRGRKAAFVVSAEEWERRTERNGSLAEFFASSPLRGARVRIKRSSQKGRKIEL